MFPFWFGMYGWKQKWYLFHKTCLTVFFLAALFPHGSKGRRDGGQLFLCDLGLVFDEVDQHSARKAKQALWSREVSTRLTKPLSNASPAKSPFCYCPRPFYSSFIFIHCPDTYLQQGAKMRPVAPCDKVSTLISGVAPPEYPQINHADGFCVVRLSRGSRTVWVHHTTS